MSKPKNRILTPSPKIQPIEDPNPIILPPLHRIFSPQTGKWHEVQGDEAAIAILGEDVFYNGPKETRTERKPCEETFDRSDDSVLKFLSHGKEDLTAEGFGTGGKGRVVERQGVLGQELGDWKDVDRGNIFGHKEANEAAMGVAL